MTDFDLEFGVRVNNVDAAVRDVGRVAEANRTAAQTTARAAQTSARAVQQLGTSVQQVGQRTGQSVAALGAFAASLGEFSPLGHAASAAVSQLGGAVGALSGAMGPLGVALGAATLGLTAYRLIASAAADVTSELTVTIDTQAASYDSLLESIRNVNRERSQRDTLALGLGSLEEQQAAVALQERTLQNLNETARALSSMAASEQNLRALTAVGQARTLTEQRLASARDALSQAQQDMEADAADFIATGRMPGDTGDEGGRRRGGGARAERDAFRSDGGAALRQMISDADAGGADALSFAAGLGTDAYAEKAQERFEAEKERAREMAEMQRQAIEQQRELADAAREASATFGDSWRGSIDDVIEAWRDAREAQQRAGQSMLSQSELLRVGMTSVGHEIADVVGGTMVGAFESALGAWLDGSKSFVEAAEDMVKGVLKALVIESIVQAVTETARGIADLAGYKYDTAALHFAAAAAWGAVGVAAGAVGGAIGAFGGGKDSSGAGASQSVTPTDASTTAAPSQPVTINVYPGGFITQRDVQAGVIDALNGAAREGYRVDPSLVGG